MYDKNYPKIRSWANEINVLKSLNFPEIRKSINL